MGLIVWHIQKHLGTQEVSAMNLACGTEVHVNCLTCLPTELRVILKFAFVHGVDSKV